MLDNHGIILGVDESGRGPLAGPVVAAAVILNKGHAHINIKDSKKIPAKKIRETAAQIKLVSTYAVATATVKEIAIMNILQATMLAMRRAIARIQCHYDIIQVDGNSNPHPERNNLCLIINGDNISRPISAASIIAKAYRDELMQKLHMQYPEYEWCNNKGYGTAKHIALIKKYGTTQEHRAFFCKKLIAIG